MSSNDRSPVDGPREGVESGPSRRAIDRERSIHLEATIVRYENRPDRCTVFPRDCTEAEKPTTWLSADRSAFVALEEMR